jgi:hypothetical protein
MPIKFQAVIVVGSLALSSAGVSTLRADPPSQVSGGDGSSIAAAVVIHATRELEGTRAEYTWLRTNHPGGEITNQSLISAGGHMYDSIEVTAADGTKRVYFFDITASYGKSD